MSPQSMRDTSPGRLQQVPDSQPSRRQSANVQRRRKRGSGGLSEVRDGFWRVEVEIPRDPVTGARRRIARTVRGTREDAEVLLAKLRVADGLGRIRRPGTKARTAGAALDAYVADIESGRIELAPRTLVTSRSARNTIKAVRLPDGRTFGNIRLSTLTWEDVELMYRQLRKRVGAPWVRRCATVLTQTLELARKREIASRLVV